MTLSDISLVAQTEDGVDRLDYRVEETGGSTLSFSLLHPLVNMYRVSVEYHGLFSFTMTMYAINIQGPFLLSS